MHLRLLSFLTEFERSLTADDPSPDGGTWETVRMVNYHLGLARLELSVRIGELLTPRGQVLLQGYQLADGTPCLKAALSWEGAERVVERAIYSKPEVNWSAEARKTAAEWAAGAPTAPVSPPALATETEEEQLQAVG